MKGASFSWSLNLGRIGSEPQNFCNDSNYHNYTMGGGEWTICDITQNVVTCYL